MLAEEVSGDDYAMKGCSISPREFIDLEYLDMKLRIELFLANFNNVAVLLLYSRGAC